MNKKIKLNTSKWLTSNKEKPSLRLRKNKLMHLQHKRVNQLVRIKRGKNKLNLNRNNRRSRKGSLFKMIAKESTPPRKKKMFLSLKNRSKKKKVSKVKKIQKRSEMSPNSKLDLRLRKKSSTNKNNLSPLMTNSPNKLNRLLKK